MAGLTRRELKQDEFRSTVEEFEEFTKQHHKEIIGVVAASILIVGLVLGLRAYMERQETEANAQLGIALKSFRAPVNAGPSPTGAQGPTFSTAQDKYKKALEQFVDVIRRYPRQKAAAIARYHAGLCQGDLGNQAAAISTLEEASHTSDRDIAALAQLALAGEYVKAGRLADAVKLYQQLANHPTSTVPRATAMLALADSYRDTQPAQARQIYQQMQREFSSDTYLAATVKQQIESLPK